MKKIVLGLEADKERIATNQAQELGDLRSRFASQPASELREAEDQRNKTARLSP
jgi:hypothetical protein